MLSHIVVFWLKKDLTEKELSTFENEVRSLENISSVEQIHVGKPASTMKRPVIDDTYDFCLTVMLRDVAAHDTYQQVSGQTKTPTLKNGLFVVADFDVDEFKQALRENPEEAKKLGLSV